MKYLTSLFVVLFSVMLLTACGGNSNQSSNDKIRVVTTFTLIEDMVKEIGGDNVEVHNLVPTGTDPHQYDPLPEDIKATTDADILFYNGLNLEGGNSGWLVKMIESVGQDWERVYQLTDGIEPKYITSSDGKEEEINPHAFLDPIVGIQMAENTKAALIATDPDRQQFYEKNTENYIDKLKEMDALYEEKISQIPEKNRILITSERAYQYMANRYGLKEGFIWAIDTEENGSPEQIKSLIEFIEKNNPPALFVETNVDKRPMETIAAETGVEIFGEILSDEIGKPGEKGDTYVKFLHHNIDVIYEGLK